MDGLALTSAQSGGETALWALMAVAGAVAAAGAIAAAAFAVRKLLRVPEFDFSVGYDALAIGPRLYVAKR